MTTETILLVGHGSREASGNEEIERFAAQWRQRQPGWRIEVCFIEFSEITLSEGLRRAATDARRVMVVPLILNAAGHVKMDIPQAIDAARLCFPQVQFLYAPHLSACDHILSVVKRRLKGAMQALDMPDPTTTGVVILGRGSSDRQANGEMAKMARWLMEETDHELVDLAFTGITWPRLEKTVQRQSLLGMTQVVVLPYYLFNGTLVERITKQVANLKAQYPAIRFTSTAYFGFEREIFELLEQRVNDLKRGAPESRMPCDGCKYREFGVENGMGGHHHDDALPHPHDHAHEHPHPHAPVIVQIHPQPHAHDHTHPHEHAHP
ncbi:MAG: sirohydrochlorin chelatase [Polaromonas sp.]|jgi:sirohydrochlorin cobaltochelatase|uniref:sirohydrochlorin chelatase n=2 Tax=Polaromonas TaxID=52972 RepID=UPI000BD092F7|nr:MULTISPECIES: sirohydrochlorin chelatase [unclassified Polaromonas]MDP2451651.1 sirohydrochlorin chelatase [Polaromonas sp.]MDP3825209.1 sirohydrochlorin chelatase [Polaromonas sp.]OYZ13349.1 MAG: cobalamin biosynthesis protein CbiX [Polaromonas sp. 16-63-31]OYZ75233.1 MAG: cobalamin biosynthesis protein CbiX [Polaromonas sp. 24-63-21]OZA44932.1 MAG: cobalamin biosynthesis protein CbiX [Polaromonas sp. 17-63-33]